MASAPDPTKTEAAIKRREDLLDKFSKALAAGDYDDALSDLWKIMQDRQLAGVEWCWRIDLNGLIPEFEGLEITEENWTATEIRWCERVLAGDPLYTSTGQRVSRTWANINPNNSMNDRLAIINAALIERRGMTIEQAAETLKKVTGRALVRATTQYAVAAGPFEDGPPTS